MQNKGALKLLVIVLAIACAYQLSFTLVTRHVENTAAKTAQGDPDRESAYLDSMKNQVVYNLGLVKYTYKQCKEKEINLGLDLKGGMNVMLEISTEEVVKVLSNNPADENLNKALAIARQQQTTSRENFIDLFAKAYSQVAPGQPLSGLFLSYELKDKVTPNMSDQQVIGILKAEAESAISNSFNVLKNRIDRFGVAQPNVQRLENSGRILVELPGVKEPERVRKLLQGTASLEFWATYDNSEIYPMLEDVNARLREMKSTPADTAMVAEAAAETVAETAPADTAGSSLISELEQGAAAPDAENLSNADMAKEFPLFSKLSPHTDRNGALSHGAAIGIAASSDTAAVNAIFAMPQIKSMLPRDLKLLWGVKPIKGSETHYELFAIRANTKDGKAPLDGGAVVEAVGRYSQMGGSAEVSMVMNPAGARTWARMTADNIDKAIAIVLDDYVYSAPNVQNAIEGGHSQITGDFTINEATDLANVLNSGKLPAPAHITSENIVGPSLGQESINAGLSSFALAFVLVLIYMLFFYNGAGLAANVALITNLFFLLGILVSFGAVLTLPGIAGIVLTMGMAVDANVIIYERIKEEIKGGKTLSSAVTDGYKNAMSAIIDGNATTLITGIVLFVFGTGPVQGFATTLVIGIITSLFTSIFITRLIFVGRLEKGRNIKFSTKLTENFLAGTKFNFIKARKYTYIVSIVLLVVTIASLATKGLNFGVDFTGGRTYVVRFDNEVTATQVRDALEPAFGDAPEVKQYGTLQGQSQMRIVTKYKIADRSDDVSSEIENILFESLNPLYKTPLRMDEFATTKLNPYGIVSADMVGPSVASDITRNSFIAVIFSLIAIGLYIALRFRKWQWAMGGVLSLAHDALLTIGIFSIFYGLLPFNLEINQAFIAAILTIIGYSINDTVVIFDRIREYKTLYPKRHLDVNINNAINSTLARTVNTAGTTLVVLLAIFIFGGEVIRGFIFGLMFGIAIGTFSSVFVATPIAYDMIKKGDENKA